MEELFDEQLEPDANGVLDLQDKHWVTLDEVVWSFAHSLLVLNVARNQLVVLPPEVGNLLLLRELRLNQNRLGVIPDQISRCVQLRILSLHHNRLTELPRSLQYCERLEEINVSFNELTALPLELGRLQHLKTLNVRHNKLSMLPHTLCDCPQLETVDCIDNPELTDIPESLRSNTRLVLWICGTVKRHRAEVEELVAINTELERMARLGDEERLALRETIAQLERDKAALLAERPKYYLYAKKQLNHVVTEVCAIM